MQELLLSDDFRKYRKAQIKQIVDHVYPMLLSLEKYQPGEIKGAVDMARKLIKLPLEFNLSKGNKDNIREQIKQDMKEFEVKFVRSHLIDE